MRNIGKGLAAWFSIIVSSIIFRTILFNFKEEFPQNHVIQQMYDNISFIFKLLIDWTSPDPSLWVIRLLIGILAFFGIKNFMQIKE